MPVETQLGFGDVDEEFAEVVGRPLPIDPSLNGIASELVAAAEEWERAYDAFHASTTAEKQEKTAAPYFVSCLTLSNAVRKYKQERMERTGR